MTQLVGGSGIGLQTPPLVPQATIAATPPFTLGSYNTGTNELSLASGQIFHVPDGTWMVNTGAYTFVQFKDPISNLWRTAAQTPFGTTRTLRSDGANVRLVNLSGCPVGAYVTNVGSAYTSAPTVTASAGSSSWSAIVGGAVSGTVTVTTAGAGYTNPPTLVVEPPPAGGVQATAIAVVSAGAIASATVVNQGAGYTTAPRITIVPDPRDTITTTGVLTTALTGAATVNAVVMTNHGTGGQTAVPTLSFSGGGGSSAAATVVMCFAATSLTNSTAGAGGGNAQHYLVTVAGGIVAGAAGAVVNPAIGVGLFVPRTGFFTGTTSAGGASQDSSAVREDGGLFMRVPNSFYTASGTSALWTTTPVSTVVVGGITDTSYIQAAP